MSNYNSLKTTIDANVKQNGVQAITGQILNSVLNAMVNTLGAGYQFAGVATTATNPGSPDAKVFYIANGKGTYTNFGGLEVTEDDVVVLYWDSSWHKVSTGIASQAKLSELRRKVGVIGSYSIEVPEFTVNTGKYIAISAHSYITASGYCVTSNIPVSVGDVVVLKMRSHNPSNFATMSISKTDDESIGSMLVTGDNYLIDDGLYIYNLECPISGFLKLSYASQNFSSLEIYRSSSVSKKTEEITIGNGEYWKFGCSDMVYRVIGNITMNQTSYPYGNIPSKSKLIFDGGIIGGVLNGNHTEIIANTIPCIDVDTTILGTFKNKKVDSRYFNDMSSVDALSKLFAIASDDSCIYVAPQESPYKVSFSAENQQKFLLKKGTHLTIDGTIHIEPNGFQRYEVFSVSVRDVVIDGVGAIVGDKDEHDYTTTTGTHEWGKGIGIHSGASNVVICGGLDISKLTGDCITLGQDTSTANPPANIKIDSLSLHDTRRQGVSVTSGKLVEITNCRIYNIDGTNPSSAIDLEADYDTVIVENVIISNNNIYDCGNGIISNFRHGLGRNVVIRNNRIDNIYPLYSGDLIGISIDNIAECLVENNTIVNYNRIGIQVLEEDNVQDGVVLIVGNTIIQDKEHYYYEGFAAPTYIPQAIVSISLEKTQLIVKDNYINVACFADALRTKKGTCVENTIVANNLFSQYNSPVTNYIFKNNKVVTTQPYETALVMGIYMENIINNIFKIDGNPNICCKADDDSIIEHNLLYSKGLDYVNDTFHTGGSSVNVSATSIRADLVQGASAWLILLSSNYSTEKNYLPSTKVYITWDGDKDFDLTYWYLPNGGTRRGMPITHKGIYDLPESYLPGSTNVGLVASGIKRDTQIRVERILTISDL